ncbi:hypothetical protein D3C81_1795470 [compost metagenome]
MHGIVGLDLRKHRCAQPLAFQAQGVRDWPWYVETIWQPQQLVVANIHDVGLDHLAQALWQFA